MSSSSSSPLRWVTFTCRFIAVVQLALGALFLFTPGPAGALLGFSEAPAWTYWLLGMLAARCLGYTIGMWRAAGDPVRHRLWIETMILVQVLDWVVTVLFVARGELTLAQVNTAAVFPVLWVGTFFVTRQAWRAPATS